MRGSKILFGIFTPADAWISEKRVFVHKIVEGKCSKRKSGINMPDLQNPS